MKIDILGLRKVVENINKNPTALRMHLFIIISSSYQPLKFNKLHNSNNVLYDC